MNADELFDEYTEGLDQRSWRSRLDEEGVPDIDAVLEETYARADEYHRWLETEIGDFPEAGDDRTVAGVVVALSVTVLVFYLIRRYQHAKSEGL